MRFNPLDSWEVTGAQGDLAWASRAVVGGNFATGRTIRINIRINGPTATSVVERLTSWAACYEQQSTLLGTIDSLGEDVVMSTQANAISGTSTWSGATSRSLTPALNGRSLNPEIGRDRLPDICVYGMEMRWNRD